MAVLTWDNASERLYETGISKCVLYLKNDNGTYADGVAWNGLVGVTEKQSGMDAIHVYASDARFMDIYDYEDFSATIEAYTYPDEFEQCNGFYSVEDSPMLIGFQERRRFGLCYKTIIGNDTNGSEHGYKIHILYNCVAEPFEREYSTINNSSDIGTFSWDLLTYPESLLTGYRQSPILVLDSRKMPLGKIESYLYGTKKRNPTLLLPNEINDLLTTHYLVSEEYEPLVFGNSRILL